MERYLAPLPITIYIHICDAKAVAEHRDVVAMRAWLNDQPESLSWLQVLDDRRLHRRGALDVSDGPFPDLVFSRDDDTLTLPYEDGLDLWQQLRAYSFLRVIDIPSIYQPVSGALFAAIASLPSISLTRMAVGTHGTREALVSEDAALHLVPGPEGDREARGSAYRPLALLPA